MKVLALYLPQFHRIEENDRWWGEGYTEWSAVRRARSLFKGHHQPRVPAEGNYYDLSEEDGRTWRWQAGLAKKYGVYGFCVYHYWFKGKQLLEKPMEILLRHPEISLRYCVCWANETWTKTWYGLQNETLMLQEYGGPQDWRAHFDYLLRFFRDERYIKVDNKPLVNIYKAGDIGELPAMLACWREWAREAGFDGLHVVASNNANDQERRRDVVDAFYDFEPGYSTKNRFGPLEALVYYGTISLKTLINKVFGTRLLERTVDIRRLYSKICRNYSRDRVPGMVTYPGLFPMWDNSPRRGHKGMAYTHHSPEAFYAALVRLLRKAKAEDFIYINAWNEWGEGCYLEPDTESGHGYLEALARANGHRA